jgi:6-pyruvoyltetrahydropterin/6-carboxytetrahydropterin synthase
MGHENKCRRLHGHNYVVWLTAQQADDGLDGLGRVIDFSVLKDRLGGWIDSNWDHGMVIFQDDHLLVSQFANMPPEDQKWYLLPTNPTAENMALFLLNEVGPEVLENTGVRLVKVTLYETENCIGEAVL